MTNRTFQNERDAENCHVVYVNTKYHTYKNATTSFVHELESELVRRSIVPIKSYWTSKRDLPEATYECTVSDVRRTSVSSGKPSNWPGQLGLVLRCLHDDLVEH